MRPSDSPRFTKTNVPGAMPMAVATKKVRALTGVNAGTRFISQNGNTGTSLTNRM
jgi:hypothetical protein